jgi:hypothetical protein
MANSKANAKAGVAPSPCQGEGWDGGTGVKNSLQVFNVFTPSCAPRIGLQAECRSAGAAHAP